MKKAHSLRAFLANAVPELREQPERLCMFVEGGHIVSTGSDSLSFAYSYTLRAVLLDFTSDLDILTVPVLLWLREHEPELLASKERRENGLRDKVNWRMAKSPTVRYARRELLGFSAADVDAIANAIAKGLVL